MMWPMLCRSLPSGFRYPYNIEHSLQFVDGISYLSRTLVGNGDCYTTKQATISLWFRVYQVASVDYPLFAGGVDKSNMSLLHIVSTAQLQGYNMSSGTIQGQKISNALLRDPTGWQHGLMVYDSNLSTAADRMQIFINGQRVTDLATSLDPGSLAAFRALHAAGNSVFLGRRWLASGYGTASQCAMAEVHVVDGLALTVDDVTDQQDGICVPRMYTGGHGTEGGYYKFANASNLGEDSSGNGNDLSVVGTGVTQSNDTPTSTQSLGNPLVPIGTVTANGRALTSSGAGYGGPALTAAITKGKQYTEIQAISNYSADYACCGIIEDGFSGTWPGTTAGSWGYAGWDGTVANNNASIATGLATWGSTNQDVIGIAVDMDALTVVFTKNGVSQGEYPIVGDSFRVAVGDGDVTSYTNYHLRTEDEMEYKPSGFEVTTNQLQGSPEVWPGDGIAAFKWVGTGVAHDVDTGKDFQPDFLLYNPLVAQGADYYRGICDSLRPGYWLNTCAATAQAAGGVTFGPGTIGVDASNMLNHLGTTCHGLALKRGRKYGFDMAQFNSNGSTPVVVNHDLGGSPDMILFRWLSGASGAAPDWYVWHKDLASGYLLKLNSTAAAFDGTGIVTNVGAASVTFNMAAGTDLFQAYFFKSIPGFSKFLIRAGNANADGVFDNFRFNPGAVLNKATNLTGSWILQSTALDPQNKATKTTIYPSQVDAPYTGATYLADFVAQGRKVRDASNVINGAYNYLVCAWAKQPGAYSNAV